MRPVMPGINDKKPDAEASGFCLLYPTYPWPSAATMCMACSSAPTTADRFSRAAFSEPGRFKIRLRPRVPATARDSMARGVMLAIGNSDVPVGQYTQKIFKFYDIDENAIAAKLTYGSNVKEVTTPFFTRKLIVSGGSLWTGIPLLNSLRIAAIAAVVVFFAGIAAAYYIAKLPRLVKDVLDVILTLPLVLPPTVVGYLILRVLGPKRLIGAWVLETFGIRLVMTWWSAIFATVIVVFPLMYRTVWGAFESFDETLAYAGRTLGLSNTYIFWRIRMPCCRQGVLAGAVLAFVRALGEYGATPMVAGYTPGKTATVSTTVYQLWQINNDALAMKWVMVNMAISAVVLLAVNMLEKRDFLTVGGRRAAK